MAEISWEKAASPAAAQRQLGGERLKFLIGGVILLGAVAYLIVFGTMSGAQYFITVDEVVNDSQYIGQSVRISGAVDGATIVYDSTNLIIDFTIVNIPSDTTDLALTLHTALLDSSATRLRVHIEGEVKPDLLQHEAQAIVSGRLGEDGVFYATELLLKCPSRYQENVPAQVDTLPGT